VHPLAAMPLAPPVPTPLLADTRVLPPKGLNTSWYLDVNQFARQTAWAHTFMHDFALWLGPVLLALVFVVVAGVAWWRRAPRAIALLTLGGIGTLVALGLNQLVAHAAKELRPYDSHPAALVLVGKTHDYSFPSDHSVVAGGLTVALLLVLGASVWRRAGAADPDATAPAGDRGVPEIVRALAAVNVVLGLFLCFARVYVGAHYPGDVVAGYVMTALVVLLVSLLRPVAYRLVDLLQPTPLGVLVRRPAGAGAAVSGQLPDPAP
jgi:membrane-associated phospholipid phosphatase